MDKEAKKMGKLLIQILFWTISYNFEFIDSGSKIKGNRVLILKLKVLVEKILLMNGSQSSTFYLKCRYI